MKKLAAPLVILALLGGVIVSVVAQDVGKTEAPAAPAAVEAVQVAEAASQPAAGEAQAEPAAAEAAASAPPEEVCFEARKGGATNVVRRELESGVSNVRCSPVTGAALWYGDPFDGTVAMGKVPELDIPEGQAVIKPRSEKLNLLVQCATACHTGNYPPGFPKDNKPVPIPTMIAMMPELQDFSHGRGAIWCLDCHHPVKRNMLVNHFGEPISIDEPHLMCGKCHGDKLRDWRDGIHGKRIGDFTSEGKKRWFTCTECHNAHDVQHGELNRGFAQLEPEKPPQLPKGMKDAKHEKLHPIPH